MIINLLHTIEVVRKSHALRTKIIFTQIRHILVTSTTLFGPNSHQSCNICHSMSWLSVIPSPLYVQPCIHSPIICCAQDMLQRPPNPVRHSHYLTPVFFYPHTILSGAEAKTSGLTSEGMDEYRNWIHRLKFWTGGRLMKGEKKERHTES